MLPGEQLRRQKPSPGCCAHRGCRARREPPWAGQNRGLLTSDGAPNPPWEQKQLAQHKDFAARKKLLQKGKETNKERKKRLISRHRLAPCRTPSQNPVISLPLAPRSPGCCRRASSHLTCHQAKCRLSTNHRGSIAAGSGKAERPQKFGSQAGLAGAGGSAQGTAAPRAHLSEQTPLPTPTGLPPAPTARPGPEEMSLPAPRTCCCRLLLENQGHFFAHLLILRQAGTASARHNTPISARELFLTHKLLRGASLWLLLVFGCEGYEKHSRIQTWQGRGGQVKFSLNRQNLQYSGRVPQHPGRGKARPRLSRQRRAQTPDFNVKTHPAHPGTQPPSATTRWLHGPILQRLHNPSSTSLQRVPANAGICCHTRVFCRKAAAPRGSRTHHEALAAPRPWGPQSQPHAGCHHLHAAPEPGPGAAAVRGKRLPLGADHSGNIYRAIYTHP